MLQSLQQFIKVKRSLPRRVCSWEALLFYSNILSSVEAGLCLAIPVFLLAQLAFHRECHLQAGHDLDERR